MTTDSATLPRERVLVVRGDLNSHSGYTRATQLYLAMLEKCFDSIVGVDLHAHPQRFVSVWPYPLIEDRLVRELAVGKNNDTTVLTISTPNNFRSFIGAKSIGLFFWETTRLGNADWVTSMNAMDELWLPASFMHDMLEFEGVTTPLRVVPCPLPAMANMTTESAEKEAFPRKLPNLILKEIALKPGPRKTTTLADLRRITPFLLLSTNSFIPRKGFPVLAQSWLDVAAAHQECALILKVTSVDATETQAALFARIEALFQNVARAYPGLSARVFVLTGSFPDRTMQELGHACDAFLTLSFGEGLGLGLFENLMIGKPVICPRHTSFQEFLPEDYPYFVDTAVANYGLADPIGVNPISAHWGVPTEGALLSAVDRLLADQKREMIGFTVGKAITHFQNASRPRNLEGIL